MANSTFEGKVLQALDAKADRSLQNVNKEELLGVISSLDKDSAVRFIYSNDKVETSGLSGTLVFDELKNQLWLKTNTGDYCLLNKDFELNKISSFTVIEKTLEPDERVVSLDPKVSSKENIQVFVNGLTLKSSDFLISEDGKYLTLLNVEENVSLECRIQYFNDVPNEMFRAGVNTLGDLGETYIQKGVASSATSSLPFGAVLTDGKEYTPTTEGYSEDLFSILYFENNEKRNIPDSKVIFCKTYEEWEESGVPGGRNYFALNLETKSYKVPDIEFDSERGTQKYVVTNSIYDEVMTAAKYIMATRVPKIVECNYLEDGSWYEVYSNGVLKQGGIQKGNGNYSKIEVPFLKEYDNVDYVVTMTSDVEEDENILTNLDLIPSVAYMTDVSGVVVGKSTKSFFANGKSTHNWQAIGFLKKK